MSARTTVLGGVLLLAACDVASAPPSVPPVASGRPASDHVDGAQAKELIARGARLIDVRSPEEYLAKHIDGAESVPVETIDGVALGSKDTMLVVYCSSGRRSARAASVLRAKGYTRVHDLGAMSNWER